MLVADRELECRHHARRERAPFASNDVVLYDRQTDPYEQTNLAYDLEDQHTVDRMLHRLEAMISDEIGEDTHAWVPERPGLGAGPIGAVTSDASPD